MLYIHTSYICASNIHPHHRTVRASPEGINTLPPLLPGPISSTPFYHNQPIQPPIQPPNPRPSISDQQQNDTTTMAQPSPQQQPQHTGTIAIDTKLFKSTVNLDCRLEVYKTAFPEMDRSHPPARPHGSMDRIWIKYEERCSKLSAIHPPMVLSPPCTLTIQIAT
jgi:hypothetical protein